MHGNISTADVIRILKERIESLGQDGVMSLSNVKQMLANDFLRMKETTSPEYVATRLFMDGAVEAEHQCYMSGSWWIDHPGRAIERVADHTGADLPAVKAAVENVLPRFLALKVENVMERLASANRKVSDTRRVWIDASMWDDVLKNGNQR